MPMRKIAVVFFAFALNIDAFAGEGTWTRDFGQGNIEYFIDQQGFRIYIGCPTNEEDIGAKAYLMLSRLSDSAAIDRFTITAGGLTYDGPLEAGTSASDENFISLIKSLHKSSAVVKFKNKTIVFPKGNAEKVIFLVDRKNHNCNIRQAVR